MPLIIDPQDRPNHPPYNNAPRTFPIEKGTLTIATACAVLGLFAGLAFDVGTRSNSLDNLTNEVKSMHSSLDTLTQRVVESDKANAVDIGQLKLEYKNLSEKVDSIMTRLEYDEAGGRRH